jgi:hypothetical protein
MIIEAMASMSKSTPLIDHSRPRNISDKGAVIERLKSILGL